MVLHGEPDGGSGLSLAHSGLRREPQVVGAPGEALQGVGGGLRVQGVAEGRGGQGRPVEERVAQQDAPRRARRQPADEGRVDARLARRYAGGHAGD